MLQCKIVIPLDAEKEDIQMSMSLNTHRFSVVATFLLSVTQQSAKEFGCVRSYSPHGTPWQRTPLLNSPKFDLFKSQMSHFYHILARNVICLINFDHLCLRTPNRSQKSPGYFGRSKIEFPASLPLLIVISCPMLVWKLHSSLANCLTLEVTTIFWLTGSLRKFKSSDQ